MPKKIGWLPIPIWCEVSWFETDIDSDFATSIGWLPIPIWCEAPWFETDIGLDFATSIAGINSWGFLLGYDFVSLRAKFDSDSMELDSDPVELDSNFRFLRSGIDADLADCSLDQTASSITFSLFNSLDSHFIWYTYHFRLLACTREYKNKKTQNPLFLLWFEKMWQTVTYDLFPFFIFTELSKTTN